MNCSCKQCRGDCFTLGNVICKKRSKMFFILLLISAASFCLISLVNKKVFKVSSINIYNVHLLWKNIPASYSFPISAQAQDDRLQLIEYRHTYVIRQNYILSSEYYVGNSTITLTTQGTGDFLHHVEELCIRWKAPVSVAVYAPGTEFILASQRIFYMRTCGHPCIKANVTWHFLYDKNHPPTVEDIAWIHKEKLPDCNVLPNRTSNYRKANKLPYPINVARNVARLQASTHYVFASDIELYPSSNIVPKFLSFISNRSSHVPEVYVLPVFEIKTGLVPPTTKKELVTRMSKKEAVFFHQRVCDVCHRFPNRNNWLKVFPPKDSLNVFVVTKRKHAWEPFYIGTNNEPIFNENFTWEGKMNKIPQAFEMCVLDYDFCILDDAFLVHAPGIKRYNASAEKFRNFYASKNSRCYSKLVEDFKKKYGEGRVNSCK